LNGLRDYGTARWDGGDPECDHKVGRFERGGVTDKQASNNGSAGDEARNSCPKCGATRIDAQIGLEPSPAEYVASLVQVFREVWRVLKPDATVWLNLGDSYAGSGTIGRNDADRPNSASLRAGIRGNENNAKTIFSGKINRIQDGLKPKDLIGIPWRVAFALQAPYVMPSCVEAERDRAWLAAMFDGEGCIGIRRFDSYREEKQQVYQDGFVVYTVVTNNDIELLHHCEQVTGFQATRLKQAANSTDGRGIVSRRDCYGWRLDGNKAVEVVCAIYPYLISKRKQACIAYTLDHLNKNGHGSRSVPADVQGKKQHLWELIKRCNQRESVDLPDWIMEPTQIVQPGWYLRSDIIWAKPSCMPESVTDRPTKSHEYLFLLAKNATYYYDADAIKEAALQPIGRPAPVPSEKMRRLRETGMSSNGSGTSYLGSNVGEPYRNRRSVWTVNTQVYTGSHFATFPEALVEPCILAGCPLGGLVLDPFCGTFTVGAVAARTGRRAVGVDLNYQDLAKERTAQRGLRFDEATA
jgi:DNA modification methylase